ncbi:uncharacterized protein N7515_001453 [Penicillium bovifimosum]|uniref:Uncharacterized protein n=1 Tax=Penicillium bovifimosum TaxID=126998 RepID=A0A9W9L8E0_9EURO|nr:uncharacterized protein N7515_001453 [Penicillium bovifimosum]KAJ5142666.1 hypothetical protein N7515_001453 [Penicillium bovifimosum]
MMLFTKFLVFLVSATSTLALNSKTVDEINEVTENVIAARKALEDWSGGILSSVPVVHRVYKAHTSAENARRGIEGSDPFDGDDGPAVLDAYHRLQPELVSAMKVTEKRAPDFKKAGVGYVARGLIGNLRTERDDFEAAMRTKMSPDHHDMVQRSIDEVNAAFDATAKALKD